MLITQRLILFFCFFARSIKRKNRSIEFVKKKILIIHNLIKTLFKFVIVIIIIIAIAIIIIIIIKLIISYFLVLNLSYLSYLNLNCLLLSRFFLRYLIRDNVYIIENC